MDKRDKKIKELEATIVGQIIMIESLLEVLYKHKIITKSEISETVIKKVRILEKASEEQKDSDDSVMNPLFYGPHGDA